MKVNIHITSVTKASPQPIIEFNKETLKALEDIENGVGLSTFNDAESFFIALDEE